MKKATLIFPILLLTVSLSAFGVNLSSYGFNVTNTQQETNQTVYTIAEPNGFSFTVVSANTITDAGAKVLQAVVSTLSGWTNLKISQAKIVLNAQRADILVIPTSFVYKNVNLAQYMPSGMQFYYDKYLEYDFRMLKDNLFLRMKGEVYDESQFAARLYSAVQNPVLFLQTNNPEYLLKRLNDLTSKLETLTQQLSVQKKEIAAAASKLSGQIALLSKEGEAFKTSQSAVNTNVAKQLADIKKQNSTMAGEFNKVRYSLLVLNNRGFFGRIYPINRTAIERVVAMKKADPSLTQDQVLTKLKAEGVKMSRKEVSLVFDVYFNEFK